MTTVDRDDVSVATSAGASDHAPDLCSAFETIAVLRWQFAAPLVVISSASVGGGVGRRDWVLNAQVPPDYARTDLEAHVAEIATELVCTGRGVGMLTAASVSKVRSATDGGVQCFATVGVRDPTWAAAADEPADVGDARGPGTINLVAFVPVRLTDDALVNAVVTATEAKSQALLEAGVPGTGTASDAVCIACSATGSAERFAGPRSAWGARLARAVHRAVLTGLPTRTGERS